MDALSNGCVSQHATEKTRHIATLEQIRIKNNIPSMAVAIISSGEVTYIKGFGFLDAMQTKPTTDESLFRIASISKLFTAQAVMQLVEDEKFIYDNILKPADMKKSSYFDGMNAYFAEARPTYKGKLIDKVDQRPYDLSFNPSEGLVSNVYDLSQWLKLTLANDSSLLKEQTYKEMLEPQIKTSWGEIHMALGWQVYKSENGNVARHPGSIRGYKSLVLNYPHSKNAMILLTNSSNTPRWEVAKSITEILEQSSEC
jgi:CubicO group peptidase (beta-lactamase class C family)